MNTNQIVQAAVQKLIGDTAGMTQVELHEVVRKVVNYTLGAVVKNIRDDDNPIMLREKIQKMEVE